MLGWIRTARGAFRFVGSLGFSVVGLGLAPLALGHPFIGLIVIAFGAGVLVAVGRWTLPWGQPAWYRRTMRAWRDWILSVRSAQDTARRRAAEIGAHVEALRVPNRFVAEAPPIVANFQPDLSTPDESELEQRLRESAERLEAAATGIARIDGEAIGPDERAYARQLREALDERLAVTARMYEDSGAACERLAASLAERSAPASRYKLQSQMKAAVAGYTRVMETARTAATKHDFQTLATLGTELRSVAEAMKSCREDLLAANPVRRAGLRPSSS